MPVLKSIILLMKLGNPVNNQQIANTKTQWNNYPQNIIVSDISFEKFLKAIFFT